MFQVVLKKVNKNGASVIKWEYFSTWEDALRYVSGLKLDGENNVADIVRIKLFEEKQ